MQPLGTPDVQRAMKELGLDEIELLAFDDSTATAELAAERIGCELGQIVKSLAFMVDGKPIVVLTSGDGMVDDRKLAQLFGVGRKKVKIAKPEQCIEIVGYAPGGVPPFGHRTPNLPIYMDTALKRYETVYAAAGSSKVNFGISLDLLVEKTQATFADVRKA